MPPHGTSPAGPARAPGRQRVPLARAAAGPAPPGTGLPAEPSLTPGRPPGTGPAQPPLPGAGPGPDGAGGVWVGWCRRRDAGRNRRNVPPLPIPSRSVGWGQGQLSPLGCPAPRRSPRPRAAEPRVAAALCGGTWLTAAPAPSYRTGKEHEKTDCKHTHIYTYAAAVRAEVRRAYASARLRRPQPGVSRIPSPCGQREKCGAWKGSGSCGDAAG